MSIAICSTQRATPSQTKAFIKYHIQIGITKIFIFLDDPNDALNEDIFKFEEVEPIKCDEIYWQQYENRPESIEKRQLLNANYALNLCRVLKIDWLLHIDVDEFINVKKDISLTDYFNSIDKNIVTIRFPVCESIPEKYEHKDFLHEIESFRCHPLSYRYDIKITLAQKIKAKLDLKMVHLKMFLLNFLGLGAFTKYGYMKAYTAGKSASRTSAKIETIGIHSPKINYQTEQFCLQSKKITILHFDAFSYGAWFKKWQKRIDGTGTSTFMHDERQQQLNEFKVLYEKNDSDALYALYKQIYFIDSKHRSLLSTLGLIKKIIIKTK